MPTLETYAHVLGGNGRTVHAVVSSPHPILPGDVVRESIAVDQADLNEIAAGRGRQTWDEFDVAAQLTAQLGMAVDVRTPVADPPTVPPAAPETVSYAEQLAAEFPNAVPASEMLVQSQES